MYLNDCKFLGRIASIPESTYTPNKTHTVSFTLAVPRQNKKDGADYIDVVAWKKTADYIDKYLQKGDLVVISGVLITTKWKDKETGETRSRLFINYARLHCCRVAKSNMIDYGEGKSTFVPVYDDEYDFPY